ncbi:lipase family protein [Zymomonas mobilis]|uniref:Secretory lipase n=1 Tax=Zymomonas mobilis subsp. mobilis (strain ATCC 31821 / ZM4 / CP4) TaxID=264203 RepID=A0A806CIP9_ZYMMO|nr:lipase family protein [Zymomonas mobilis]ADC33897.1 secretory lipase [Zymomonas mobilis subsp. mobilis ZM4 = ATCC 31821]AHB11130.1 Secretory lipase [Zymomonas mobilis subsp. mobilis str. CP4 = NRRL B-14023]AHJ71469.1 Secretory lipase [Zymomonas mobilis subsp. mobilis NRRL B-12526]
MPFSYSIYKKLRIFVGISCCFIAIPGYTALAKMKQMPGFVTASSFLPKAYSLPGAGRSLRITYLSTNGVTGQGLVPVTAEVILPAGKAPAGGWPIVAWAHGTVGVSNNCAPSRNPWSERNSRYLSEWMKRGFAIVATDYQGLGTPLPHPYLNTRAEAYGLLDAVRAAISSAAPLENKIMIVGQSQGGGAAFASAAFAPKYAPELNIRGIVATGTPYMTPELLKQITKPSDNMAYNPMVVYSLYLAQGFAGYHPSFKPREIFTPRAMPAYRAAAKVCVGPLTAKVKKEGLNFDNSLKPDFSEKIAPALAAMQYPTMKLKYPLFTGTGELDKDVPPALQLALVKAACAAGTTVEAHLYKGLDHSQTVNASLPDSAVFTNAVMSGKTITSQCEAVPQ